MLRLDHTHCPTKREALQGVAYAVFCLKDCQGIKHLWIRLHALGVTVDDKVLAVTKPSHNEFLRKTCVRKKLTEVIGDEERGVKEGRRGCH